MDSFILDRFEMFGYYESLLKSGQLSDVVLVAGGKEHRAHKVLLCARSPVFAAMLTNPSTKEAQENRVEIVDVDAEVLELMLRYIYTAKVQVLDRYATDLLMAADKYQLDYLKSICEQHFLSKIAAESVLDLLTFADTYQVTGLYAKCLKYITNNRTQVMASEGWKAIVVNVDLMAKICAPLNLDYSEQLLLCPITIKSVSSLLILADAHQVGELTCNCLNYITNNGPDVMTSEGWMRILARTDLMTKLYAHLHQRYGMLVYFSDIKKKVESRKKEDDDKRIDWTPYAAELLIAADKYKLNSLKSICEQLLLSEVITTESVSDLLLFAYTHQVTELFSKCVDYIGNNVSQVMASKGWNLIVAKTELLVEVCESWTLYFVNQLRLCPITIETVANFLILADMLQVTELTAKCIDYISNNVTEVLASNGWKAIVTKTGLLAEVCDSLNLDFADQLLLCPITTESVSELLVLAEMHCVTELITKCLDYITDNGTEVMDTDGWKKKIVVKDYLLDMLFEHLSCKYSNTKKMALEKGERRLAKLLIEHGSDSENPDSSSSSSYYGSDYSGYYLYSRYTDHYSYSDSDSNLFDF